MTATSEATPSEEVLNVLRVLSQSDRQDYKIFHRQILRAEEKGDLKVFLSTDKSVPSSCSVSGALASFCWTKDAKELADQGIIVITDTQPEELPDSLAHEFKHYVDSFEVSRFLNEEENKDILALAKKVSEKREGSCTGNAVSVSEKELKGYFKALAFKAWRESRGYAAGNKLNPKPYKEDFLRDRLARRSVFAPRCIEIDFSGDFKKLYEAALQHDKLSDYFSDGRVKGTLDDLYYLYAPIAIGGLPPVFPRPGAWPDAPPPDSHYFEQARQRVKSWWDSQQAGDASN